MGPPPAVPAREEQQDLCPLSRMFAFQHGRRPAEDPFLRSAWRYLLGARPQLAAAVGPVLTPRPARQAS